MKEVREGGMQISGGKSCWQREQPVQRPWGERMTIVFKERQGSRCGWNRRRRERVGDN